MPPDMQYKYFWIKKINHVLYGEVVIKGLKSFGCPSEESDGTARTSRFLCSGCRLSAWVAVCLQSLPWTNVAVSLLIVLHFPTKAVAQCLPPSVVWLSWYNYIHENECEEWLQPAHWTVSRSRGSFEKSAIYSRNPRMHQTPTWQAVPII